MKLILAEISLQRGGVWIDILRIEREHHEASSLFYVGFVSPGLEVNLLFFIRVYRRIKRKV